MWKARRYIDTFDQVAIEWTPLTDHLPSLAVSTMAGASVNHPDVIYVGTGEGFNNADASSGVGMFKTSDGGNTWTHLTSTSNNPDWAFVNRIVVDPNNPDIVVAVTNANIFRSEDGGQSFSTVLPKDDNRGSIQDLRAKPDDFKVQFATVNGTGILRSTDGGKTWKNSFSGLVYGGGRIELAISQSHPEVVWASVEGSEGTNFRLKSALYQIFIGPWMLASPGVLVENLESVPESFGAFLSEQGWYDNAITLFTPFHRTQYFSAVSIRWKAWMEGDETLLIRDCWAF